jgi:hypothetical protein
MSIRFLLAFCLLLFGGAYARAQAPINAQVVTSCGTPNSTYNTGQNQPVTQDGTGKACVNATVTATASITGFTAASVGTPITATTGGATGTLPAGAVVVATNVGPTNGAYCALGASSSTAQQYIAPGGGWFAFTVGASTQLTCVTSASTTIIDTVGGSGLPTGVGGAVAGATVAISQATPGTTNAVSTNPGSRTLVALDISTVTTGGTAVTALNAGHRTAGGWLQNPPNATINLCINEIGTASGTTSAASTTCIQPGQSYTLAPAAGAVSVISSDSSHPFSGEGWQ